MEGVARHHEERGGLERRQQGPQSPAPLPPGRSLINPRPRGRASAARARTPPTPRPRPGEASLRAALPELCVLGRLVSPEGCGAAPRTPAALPRARWLPPFPQTREKDDPTPLISPRNEAASPQAAGKQSPGRFPCRSKLNLQMETGPRVGAGQPQRGGQAWGGRASAQAGGLLGGVWGWTRWPD